MTVDAEIEGGRVLFFSVTREREASTQWEAARRHCREWSNTGPDFGDECQDSLRKCASLSAVYGWHYS